MEILEIEENLRDLADPKWNDLSDKEMDLKQA